MKSRKGVVADLVPYKNLVTRIKETDQFVKENYPAEQPYIYTADGYAIVFRKKVGFEPPAT